MGNRRLNLLTNDKLRSALRDEAEELRPQVPVVLHAELLPRAGERLARARPSPAFEVRDPGEPEGVGPSADSGKKMTLGILTEIFWLHGCDASFIYCSFWNQSLVHEFPQPFAGGGVALVVVHPGAHRYCSAGALPSPSLVLLSSSSKSSVFAPSRKPAVSTIFPSPS